jgi:hypothetical protein
MPTEEAPPTPRPLVLLPVGGASTEWDETTLHPSYRRRHHADPLVYVEVVVLNGRLRLTTWADGSEHTRVLHAGQKALLPSLTEYAIEPEGPMRCTIQRFIEDDPTFVPVCPVCKREIEYGTNHDTCRDSWPGVKQERFYGRPRVGEGASEFTGRMTSRVLGLVEVHHREHPGPQNLGQDEGPLQGSDTQ